MLRLADKRRETAAVRAADCVKVTSAPVPVYRVNRVNRTCPMPARRQRTTWSCARFHRGLS
jgi:hypothetical protein